MAIPTREETVVTIMRWCPMHYRIEVDTQVWRPCDPEQALQIRTLLGYRAGQLVSLPEGRCDICPKQKDRHPDRLLGYSFAHLMLS